MPSYWVVRPGGRGNEAVRLEGANVDVMRQIMSIPYKPTGSSLRNLMEVEVDEKRRPNVKAVEAGGLERLPVDSILWIPDDGTKFELLSVKRLDENAVEVLTDEDKDVFGKKIDWALTGKTFEKEHVLRKTLVSVGRGEITTANDLFAALKKMGGKELVIVRDILKANVLIMARKIDEVSDMQFVFAMHLLSEVGDERDRKTGDILLEKIRGEIDQRMKYEGVGDHPSRIPEKYGVLLNLLSTGDRREIFSGVGVLKKDSVLMLEELTKSAERSMHKDGKLYPNETSVLAVQLMAACQRIALKLVHERET